MTRKLKTLATALLLGLLVTCGAHAAEPAAAPAKDDSLDLLLSTIRANRRALVEVNLKLTAEEAAKFWPLYEQYQKELNVQGDRISALVKEYIENFASLTDETALRLIGDYLDAESKRLEIRRNYLPQFGKILPGRTVARFYQIENKIDAVLRYDLASTIPVVDDSREGGGK